MYPSKPVLSTQQQAHGAFHVAPAHAPAPMLFHDWADAAEDPIAPFCFLMDASMLGVGVGFDTKGAGKINVIMPGSADSLEHGESQVKALELYIKNLCWGSSCGTVNNVVARKLREVTSPLALWLP